MPNSESSGGRIHLKIIAGYGTRKTPYSVRHQNLIFVVKLIVLSSFRL